jgi:LmbE family N-acetylglucosaminyl deacetylase
VCRARVALLLSPHPDDELLGCPAHLLGLRDAGWGIVNLALTLGGDPDRRERRRGELERASAHAGFALELWPEDLATSGAQALEHVLSRSREHDASLLVAPSPHDHHPAHEATGRLAVQALRAGASERLWLWGLWADLALPSSLCVFDDERLAQIDAALLEHAGELARNDYTRLLRARAEAAAVLLPERVFGPGAGGLEPRALAEGVCEVQIGLDGGLQQGPAWLFDAARFPPERERLPSVRLEAWLDAPSTSTLIARGR